MTAGTVAIVGTGALMRRLRQRATGAGATVSDDDRAALTVVEGVAPQPNYLGVISSTAPQRIYVDATSEKYVLDLVTEFAAAGARGVQARGPVINEWSIVGNEAQRRRRLKKFRSIEFDWDTDETVESEVFDSDVELTGDGESTVARIRVSGYLNPSDGQFHWAGTAYGDDVRRWRDARVRDVMVMHSGVGAAAKLTDITPWGTVRIVGVGTPPFAVG